MLIMTSLIPKYKALENYGNISKMKKKISTLLIIKQTVCVFVCQLTLAQKKGTQRHKVWHTGIFSSLFLHLERGILKSVINLKRN